MFIDAFTRHAGRIALRQADGRCLTYAELASAARALGLAGAQRRELIAIFCSNSIDSIVGYVAVLLEGHVALLLAGEPHSALNAALLSHFQVSKTWAPDSDGAYRLRDTGHEPPALHDSLALLLSTSGSTGSKKLVRLSQRNLYSNAESIATYLGIDASDRPITTLPMHYSYGLSIINSHLLRGAEVLLTDESIIGRVFWPFAREFGATSFGGVPLTYQLLHRMGEEQMDLPTLRYFTQAGGRLDAALVCHFADLAQRTGRRFYVMYGQTEATARIAYLPPELASANPTSIGRPIPGGELAIVDASGAPVPGPDVSGELVYRGANVMLGYAERATDLALPDQLNGVLRTGDIASRDGQGLYFINGRMKRFIKINGNRVGLDEIESFLAEQGYRAAVVGQDEKLQLLLEGEADAALPKLLWQTFSIHPRNCAVRTCEALPRSAAGKIVYPEVSALFA
jgi:acyl-CoA synthetase (AMP-forming)/AMP-acid ligase II